jgi:hypothetical protein
MTKFKSYENLEIKYKFSLKDGISTKRHQCKHLQITIIIIIYFIELIQIKHVILTKQYHKYNYKFLQIKSSS